MPLDLPPCFVHQALQPLLVFLKPLLGHIEVLPVANTAMPADRARRERGRGSPGRVTDAADEIARPGTRGPPCGPLVRQGARHGRRRRASARGPRTSASRPARQSGRSCSSMIRSRWPRHPASSSANIAIWMESEHPRLARAKGCGRPRRVRAGAMKRTVIVGVVGIAGGAIAADQLRRRRERLQRIREAERRRRLRAARSNRNTVRNARTAALRKAMVTKMAKREKVGKVADRAKKAV